MNSKSERLLPVGSLRPNGLGLFDMHGNVLEWCQGRAMIYGTVAEFLEDKEQPERISNAKSRVLRGGSFFLNAAPVRSSVRLNFQPDIQNATAGFRVARTYR